MQCERGLKDSPCALITSCVESHEDLNSLCCLCFPSCGTGPEMRPVEEAAETRKTQEIKSNTELNQHSVTAVFIIVTINKPPERERELLFF